MLCDKHVNQPHSGKHKSIRDCSELKKNQENQHSNQDWS